MGKSKTSPLSKTASVIGAGGGGVSAVVSTASAQASATAQPTPPVQPTAPVQPVSQQNAMIQASKVASIYGNDTVAKFATMTDDQLAQAVKDAKNVDMPNHIADIPDPTQNFVFANGLNAKPTVLSDSDFDDYIKNNKISSTEYLIREVNPITTTVNGVKFKYSADDINDMFKSGDLNYIGGKHGGQVYGAGTYFAMGGFNHQSGYGNGKDGVDYKTMVAVFDKSKTKVISASSVGSEWKKFSKTHPKTASQTGLSSSIRALLMGYNVITSNGAGLIHGPNDTYYNVIDRSCLVVRASNRK